MVVFQSSCQTRVYEVLWSSVTRFLSACRENWQPCVLSSCPVYTVAASIPRAHALNHLRSRVGGTRASNRQISNSQHDYAIRALGSKVSRWLFILLHRSDSILTGDQWRPPSSATFRLLVPSDGAVRVAQRGGPIDPRNRSKLVLLS